MTWHLVTINYSLPPLDSYTYVLDPVLILLPFKTLYLQISRSTMRILSYLMTAAAVLCAAEATSSSKATDCVRLFDTKAPISQPATTSH